MIDYSNHTLRPWPTPRWLSWMLHYLYDFCPWPRAVVHNITFLWPKVEHRAFRALKVILTQALFLRRLNWNYTFVDAYHQHRVNVVIGPCMVLVILLSKKRCVTLTPLFEMEAWGMIYSVNKLHYILWIFVVHVNLSTLLYFFIVFMLNGNLAHWTVLLQDIEFTFCTQHMHLYVSHFEIDETVEGSLDDLPTVVIRSYE